MHNAWSSDKKRARPCQTRPLFYVSDAGAFALKLEAEGELNLPLAEDRVAGGGVRPECRERSECRPRQSEGGIVDRSDLSSIEEVKAFDQKLKICCFVKAEAAREARVHVDDLRLPEAVASERQEETITA